MNTEDILRMAQEASLICVSEPVTPWIEDTDLTPHLLRFAKLLSDARYKESMKWDVHTCGPTCKRYACVATREAVAAEREACAKVCDENSVKALSLQKKSNSDDLSDMFFRHHAMAHSRDATAIRARAIHD